MKDILQERDELPNAFFSLEVRDLADFFGGPVLFHLKGERTPPLFLTTLLHGNEHSGFLALQALLSAYRDRKLPRETFLFLGNVRAAKTGARFLPDQNDFNRIWIDATGPEALLVEGIRDRMKSVGLFASVDIHNNTGRNPHYACVSSLDRRHLNLALLFRRTIVYFTKPHTTQSAVFSKFAPAISIECGHSGDPSGVDHIREFLSSLLHLEGIPVGPVRDEDVDLYETFARLVVRPDADFEFGPQAALRGASLVLREDLDALNFRELEPETVLGWSRSDALVVQDPDGAANLEDSCLTRSPDGTIRTARPLIPSMLTLNADVIRQDCLGYFMKRRKV